MNSVCISVGKRKHQTNPVLEITDVLEAKKSGRKIINQSGDINLLKVMETRTANLANGMKILRDDNCKLSDMVVDLKKQVVQLMFQIFFKVTL